MTTLDDLMDELLLQRDHLQAIEERVVRVEVAVNLLRQAYVEHGKHLGALMRATPVPAPED